MVRLTKISFWWLYKFGDHRLPKLSPIIVKECFWSNDNDKTDNDKDDKYNISYN